MSNPGYDCKGSAAASPRCAAALRGAGSQLVITIAGRIKGKKATSPPGRGCTTIRGDSRVHLPCVVVCRRGATTMRCYNRPHKRTCTCRAFRWYLHIGWLFIAASTQRGVRPDGFEMRTRRPYNYIYTQFRTFVQFFLSN